MSIKLALFELGEKKKTQLKFPGNRLFVEVSRISNLKYVKKK